MNFERYCWRDHAVPHGQWRVDVGIAALFVAILGGMSIGQAPGVNEARHTAAVPASDPAMHRLHQPSKQSAPIIHCNFKRSWSEPST